MLSSRRCSKTGCNKSAVATLTYSYADQQAVVGPLAARHEPGSYDLCKGHAVQITAPRGWEIVRLPLEQEPAASRADDLIALAAAVREAAFTFEGDPVVASPMNSSVVELAHRGHLTVITDAERYQG